MPDFSQMSARELRSIAPTYGITGASRKLAKTIRAELDALHVEAVVEGRRRGIHLATVAPIGGDFDKAPRVVFDREARDALAAQPVLVYDPAEQLTKAHLNTRGARVRSDRRHYTVKSERGDLIVKTLPRQQRRRGVQVPATREALMLNRVALGVAR